MASVRSSHIALSALLVGTFVLAAWIASPLWVGIVLGAAMAFATQPLFLRLADELKGKRRVAAAIVTFASGAAGLALLAGAVYVLTDELVSLAAIVQERFGKHSLDGLLGGQLAKMVDQLGIPRDAALAKIQDQLSASASWVAAQAATAAQTATHALLALVMALITMYYVLVAWPMLMERATNVSPLDPRHSRALLLELRDVGRGALLGGVATALVQGTLAGIGYAIAGVERAVTWAVVTAIASFVPLVGTIVVWIPIGIYLLTQGQVGGGIFVLTWGALVVVALSDYAIRPRLVGKTTGDDPYWMLIALLGGLEVMGLAGLLVGPIVMSLFLSVLRIYEREASPTSEVTGSAQGPAAPGV